MPRSDPSDPVSSDEPFVSSATPCPDAGDPLEGASIRDDRIRLGGAPCAFARAGVGAPRYPAMRSPAAFQLTRRSRTAPTCSPFRFS